MKAEGAKASAEETISPAAATTVVELQAQCTSDARPRGRRKQTKKRKKERVGLSRTLRGGNRTQAPIIATPEGGIAEKASPAAGTPASADMQHGVQKRAHRSMASD